EKASVLLISQHAVSQAFLTEAKTKIQEALTACAGVPKLNDVEFRLLSQIDTAAEGEDHPANVVSFPIMASGRTSGLLWLGGKAVARITPETESLLVQIANQAHMVTENSRLFDRVKNLSVRDSLTDLFNHRHAMERLATEFSRVGRYREALGVLMADIDHFKSVNDTYGHQAGDHVLREVARVLSSSLRTIDLIGRYGGEEFIIILPNTRQEETLHTGERLRATIERHAVQFGGKPLSITISIGMAAYPSAKHIDSPSALVREADKALYRAKAGGRNCVA
ncbi:MAG: GGDEF domain-containing protein, partial [Vicinamibacteria bacterium]|nr:GGDEF domain-containing protein [Vicinamibacteria bacterium]